MIEIKKCSICEKSDFKNHLESKDFSVTGEDFNIQECIHCGFIFTNPRPDDKDLEKYYISDNYISHTDKNKSLFEKTYQIIKKISINQKFRLITSYIKNGSILDIGCGTGAFLYKFKKNNWKTKGVEPSEIARKKGVLKYDLDITSSVDLKKISGKYDVITMWHVLEHMPDLNSSINDLCKLLSQKGKIVLAVPNIESYDCQYYKKYWAAYDLPIHLSHFSKKSISNLFENYNFKLSYHKGMIFDSFYVSLLSENYKHGKKNLIRSFFVGVISNLYGIFTKRGFSSTLFIFEKNNE